MYDSRRHRSFLLSEVRQKAQIEAQRLFLAFRQAKEALKTEREVQTKWLGSDEPQGFSHFGLVSVISHVFLGGMV